MMIQLLTIDDEVLFELPKSEIFPDYVSVLREAIKLQVNIDNLCVRSMIVNNIVWRSLKFERIFFRNCIMINNTFEDSKGCLNCIECNLDRLKIKKSKVNLERMRDCNITNLSYRNSESDYSIFENCNLSNSVFKGNTFSSFWFDFCQLSNSCFENCELRGVHFKSSNENNDWYNNLTFLNCKFKESVFQSNVDLSKMTIWDINYEGVDFEEDVVRFVDIVGKTCKVIVCCYSNVVWWSRRFRWDDDIIYRHSFAEFIEEVKNGFPTTEIYPELDDNEEDNELSAVCEYLKFWIEYNKL